MFENIDPNEEMSAQEMIDLLSDPELIESYGYRMTPKGCMALILMKELEIPLEEADELSTKMDNLIFMNKWIYLQEEHVRMVDE